MSNEIITIKKKENQNLEFVILRGKEGFTEKGLLATVKKRYDHLYSANSTVELIPIGGGYTDIKVTIAKDVSPRILIWSFDTAKPFVND